MPAFVIHAMGKDPIKAVVDAEEVRVGRHEDNDIVLPGSTVSRKHASFYKPPGMPWTIRCESATNPIAVDGELVKSETLVADGAEVQIGADFLLVFVENENALYRHMGARSVYAKTSCTICGWSGMLSALNARPVCPACGNREVKRGDEYDRDAAQDEASAGSTEMIDAGAVRAQLNRIRTAKRSRLERLDDGEGPRKRELDEDSSLTLSKRSGAGFKLFGVTMGEGVTVRWDGTHHRVESSLSYPAMKVNGEKKSRAILRDGDEIEIGKNQFRYVTD